MKLAIVGHGKMGRMVEALAPAAGFTVCARVDREANVKGAALTREALAGADVAIEFSEPSAAAQNIERLAAAGVNTVCGTTGWYSELPRVAQQINRAGTALVWGSNFSVGVNLFARVVSEAARLFAAHPEYGAWAWEIHHAAKKDAPSGTLLQLVQQMERAGYSRPVNTSSSRAGAHPGTHEIGFDSAGDTITLRHTSRHREGFAQGALLAARWIAGRRGVFEFQDVLFGEHSAKSKPGEEKP
jgi:4-hydroxy-tetrahydrodipicolinate reductase